MATFVDNLSSLGFASYADYLKSPLWASIRSRVYASKGRMCIDCKSHRATQIHHRQYDLATLKGDTLNYLVPVCRNCHRKEHGLEPAAPVAVIVIPWNPNQRCPSKSKSRASRSTKQTKQQQKANRKRKSKSHRGDRAAPTSQPEPTCCSKCKRLVKRMKLDKITGMCEGCIWTLKQAEIRKHNKALMASRRAARAARGR